MVPTFWKIVAGAEQLPDATALDGELVVWDAPGASRSSACRTDRLARRSAYAARTAGEWPDAFAASDLLRLSGPTRPDGRTGGAGRR
jgi:hypothetical protein